MTHENFYRNWDTLSDSEKVDDLFLQISSEDQKEILDRASLAQSRNWLRSLEPDDLVDLLQLFNEDELEQYLDQLDPVGKREALGLLAYRADVAGGLMNTRYARLRLDMSVDGALTYLREQTISSMETIYYAYILSSDQKLLGVVSLRQLFFCSSEARDSRNYVQRSRFNLRARWHGRRGSCKPFFEILFPCSAGCR